MKSAAASFGVLSVCALSLCRSRGFGVKESGEAALNGGWHFSFLTGSAYVDEWHFFLRGRSGWHEIVFNYALFSTDSWTRTLTYCENCHCTWLLQDSCKKTKMLMIICLFCLDWLKLRCYAHERRSSEHVSQQKKVSVSHFVWSRFTRQNFSLFSNLQCPQYSVFGRTAQGGLGKKCVDFS